MTTTSFSLAVLLKNTSHNKLTNNSPIKMTTTSFSLAVLLVLLAMFAPQSEAQHCRPFGHFIGKSPPPGKCNPSVSDCCVDGKIYNAYHCSPPVSYDGETKAVLTLNNFEASGATTCDGLLHSDDEPVVSLPTGWYNGGKRCGREIVIKIYDGNSARARVVDHCDSSWGCDEPHRYEAPCRYNGIDASRAVWKQLGVPQGEWKELNVTWTEV